MLKNFAKRKTVIEKLEKLEKNLTKRKTNLL